MPLSDFLSAYRGREAQQNAAPMQELQQMGALQGILAKVREQQQSEAYRGALAGLGPNPSTDALAAVAAKFGGPKEILAHADRVSGQQATKEAAMARLQAAAQNFQQNFQLRMSAAKTAEEKLALQQQAEAFKQQLQGEAARLAGAKANYDFGFMPSAPIQPTVAPAAPAQTPSTVSQALPPNVPESDRAAYLTALGGGAGTVDRVMSPNETARMGDLGFGAAPNNLDARDLGAWSKGPVIGPTPTAAPAQPARAIPPMPPEIARAPRKVQDQWLAAQGKALSKMDINLAGGRESMMHGRVILSANEAAADLENVVKLPMTASRGLFGGRGQESGIFNAGKETLANAMTTQEVQTYNVLATGFQRSLAAIESSGLAPTNTLSHQMDAVLFKEGDTNYTKLFKLAQTRQIVEKGLETMTSNPRVAPETKAHIKEIVSRVEKAVPFSVADVLKMQARQQTNPNVTLGDVIGFKNESPATGGWSIRPR